MRASTIGTAAELATELPVGSLCGDDGDLHAEARYACRQVDAQPARHVVGDVEMTSPALPAEPA